MATTFERRIEFRAAFDKRSTDPKKDYGIHGVEIRFVLRGPKGATHFLLFTNWQLPHVRQEGDERTLREIRAGTFSEIALRVLYHPMPADLGYHAYTPQYEGQTARKCDLLTDGSGECYYDGSCLQAEPVFERLLREGDAGVWAALEEEYLRQFETISATPNEAVH